MSPPPGPYYPALPSDAPASKPPPSALVDENLRYRQVLGAYQRPWMVAPPPPRRHVAFVRLKDRTKRRHDGFYLRFGGGIGAGHDSVHAGGPIPISSDLDLGFSPELFYGAGTTFTALTELAVGFAPASGVVIGIGSYTASLPSLSVSVKDPITGNYAYRVSQLSVLGPFVDWYPRDQGGFHVEGSPGLATYVAGAAVPANAGPIARAHTAVGFGFMLGVGYEWWVADQWSLGVLGRLTYGTTNGTDDHGVDWHHSTYSPGVLLTLTYQ